MRLPRETKSFSTKFYHVKFYFKFLYFKILCIDWYIIIVLWLLEIN